MRLIDADKLNATLEYIKGIYLENRGEIRPILEHIIEVVNAQPTVGIGAPEPCNYPFTLDELHEMDGEPVWIVDKQGRVYADVLCNVAKSEGRVYIRPIMHQRLQENGYGQTWLAYRNKPRGT